MSSGAESYKYFILLIYVLCNTENAFINFTYSPIIKSLRFAYNVSDFDIYYLAISFSIFYLFMNFPANHVIEQWGIRSSLLIFSMGQILCCTLRLFINQSLIYIYIGQTIAALSCPFCNNVVSKISLNWFNPKQRIISTSLMTSSFMLGSGFTFILSTFFVEDPTLNPDISSQKNEVLSYMASGLFLSVGVFLIVFFFFIEKPENPCCLVSEYPRETSLDSLKIILKNRNFLYLCSGFSLQTSNFCLFVVYINFIISPFGFAENQIAYIGSWVNLFCFFGKLTIGFLVYKHLSFKKALFYICISLFISTAGFLLSLISGSSFLILLFSGLFGFFMQMYWSPSYEFACELIFPAGEANANGGLILCGCLVNVVFGFIFSKVFSLSENIWAPFAFSYFLLTTCFSLFFFQKIDEDMNREKKEIELKSKTESNINLPLLDS